MLGAARYKHCAATRLKLAGSSPPLNERILNYSVVKLEPYAHADGIWYRSRKTPM